MLKTLTATILLITLSAFSGCSYKDHYALDENGQPYNMAFTSIIPQGQFSFSDLRDGTSDRLTPVDRGMAWMFSRTVRKSTEIRVVIYGPNPGPHTQGHLIHTQSADRSAGGNSGEVLRCELPLRRIADQYGYGVYEIGWYFDDITDTPVGRSRFTLTP